MSFTDVLTRISEIQQQITTLTGAGSTASTAASGSTSTSTSDAASDASGSSTSQFAQALAEAQLTDSSSADDTGSSSDDSLLSSLLSATGSQSADPDSSLAGVSTDLSGADLSTALPADASTELTSEQQQFASTLVADTGLNPGVVSAWLLAEESGGAAQSRQSSDNNDWLNIGYTDSGTDGAGDSVWSDPVSAATATAAWLKGQDSIPGYGTASPSIQSILATVGQTPASQISALQTSGWASSGYPSLASLYAQVTGGQT